MGIIVAARTTTRLPIKNIQQIRGPKLYATNYVRYIVRMVNGCVGVWIFARPYLVIAFAILRPWGLSLMTIGVLRT